MKIVELFIILIFIALVFIGYLVWNIDTRLGELENGQDTISVNIQNISDTLNQWELVE